MALQGMHHVFGGECAPAEVPLDALAEVERPRLPIWTHAPVGGQHRHEIVPRVFLHQGFDHRCILSGIDDTHEHGIVLFAFQLHGHLQTFHPGWSGRGRRWEGRRLCWRRAPPEGQQHKGHGHSQSATSTWSPHSLLLPFVDTTPHLCWCDDLCHRSRLPTLTESSPITTTPPPVPYQVMDVASALPMGR